MFAYTSVMPSYNSEESKVPLYRTSGDSLVSLIVPSEIGIEMDDPCEHGSLYVALLSIVGCCTLAKVGDD